MNTSIQFAAFGSLLTDQEYAEYHSLRKQASTMDFLQLQKLQSLINTNFNKEKKLTVLSIGSGKGDFDKDFIRSIASKIDRYVCVEPMKEHLDLLKKNLLEVLSEEQIEIHQAKAEDFYANRQFDVIHNVHVIHWANDPVGVLKKLESYLKTGGLNITVLQSEKGMPRLYSWLKPGKEGSLTAEKLFKDMLNSGMNHYCLDYVPAELDVQSLLKEEEEGKKILQFIISSKLTDLQFQQALPFIRSLAITRQNKAVISEPFAFIVNRSCAAKKVGFAEWAFSFFSSF